MTLTKSDIKALEEAETALDEIAQSFASISHIPEVKKYLLRLDRLATRLRDIAERGKKG